MSGISDDRSRQYLLHRLPEAEAVQFEECILEEEGCAERLREAEDDLLDDYAAGRLAIDEGEAVERFLLHSPDGRQRLRFARAFAAMARESGSSDAATESISGRNARANAPEAPPHVVRTFRARKWIAPLGLLMAASVAFALFVVPAVRRSTPASALPGDLSKEEPVTAPPGTAAPRPDQATPYAVLLLAETQRGSGDAQRIAIPSGAEQVQLQLEVGDRPSTPGQSTSYRVTVRDLDGQQLFVSDSLAAREVAAYRIVETVVPARVLGTGERRVFLTRVERDAAVPVFDWNIALLVGGVQR